MKRCLVVDDESSWVEHHTKQLHNYITNEVVMVDTANSAYDGYKKIIENLRNPYNIIITDLQMEDNFLPKLAGEWLIERINSHSEYTFANKIIISAAANIVQIAKQNGVKFLKKTTAANFPDAYEELVNQ